MALSVAIFQAPWVGPGEQGPHERVVPCGSCMNKICMEIEQKTLIGGTARSKGPGVTVLLHIIPSPEIEQWPRKNPIPSNQI